jgi:transcriptional regulator with XRE-family HTH domain
VSGTHPIVEQLADLRRAHQLDRAAVAARAGVRTQHLKYWETGHYTPSTVGLQVWAQALGCAVAVRPRAGIPQLGSPAGALTALRRRRGLRQADVADLAGGEMTASQLSRWEAGVNVPGLWSLSEWANALGCDLMLVPAVVMAVAA